jgi:hypothetical protein
MGVGWLGSGSCRVVGHAWIDPVTADNSPLDSGDIATDGAGSLVNTVRTVSPVSPAPAPATCQRCGARNEPRPAAAGYQPRHLRAHVPAPPPVIERRIIAAPRSHRAQAGELARPPLLQGHGLGGEIGVSDG